MTNGCKEAFGGFSGPGTAAPIDLTPKTFTAQVFEIPRTFMSTDNKPSKPSMLKRLIAMDGAGTDQSVSLAKQYLQEKGIAIPLPPSEQDLERGLLEHVQNQLSKSDYRNFYYTYYECKETNASNLVDPPQIEKAKKVYDNASQALTLLGKHKKMQKTDVEQLCNMLHQEKIEFTLYSTSDFDYWCLKHVYGDHNYVLYYDFGKAMYAYVNQLEETQKQLAEQFFKEATEGSVD
jgi:hypothetical protein